MRIATWNVNSLRARYDRIIDFVDTRNIDVLCMQETKCKNDNFPEFDIRTQGYDVSHHGLSQYNGVAILSKEDQKNVTFGIDNKDDPYLADARVIKSDINDISFVSVYAPNGRDRNSEHFEMKLNWYDQFIIYCKNLLEDNPETIITGDLNIAPTDDDVWDINEFSLSTHVTKEEREKFTSLLNLGLVDAQKHVSQTEQAFTFWDYRGGDFHQNRGMRIDFFLVSQDLAPQIKSLTVDRESRKGKKPSDHAALILELDV